MSSIFLKDKIDGVRVPKFQLTNIIESTHTSHDNCLGFVVAFIIFGGVTKSCNFKSARIS